MSDYNKQEILDYYNNLCSLSNKKLTRADYRKLEPKYSSTLIENIWGNWTNFITDAATILLVSRNTIVKEFSEKANKVVITYVNDGTTVNEGFLNTLLNYCKHNKAELGVLWGKSEKKNRTFDEYTYSLLAPYLATKFTFKKDPTCIAQDFLIPVTQKNPLLNLDKFSTDIKTIIVGSNKQYLKILPYKQYTTYRIACSTGGLSEVDYKDTVAGHIDAKYHKFGAILLEWNEEYNRYIVRNLIYNKECIHDLNKVYYEKSVKQLNSIPAMVLGDLHFPDEDTIALNKTSNLIEKLKPEYVMLHDLASWNSISHHEATQYLSQVKNQTEETTDLKTELKAVLTRLYKFAEAFPKVKFKIVNSNHDCFIEKWLEKGEFVKDRKNSIIGAKLFIKYAEGNNIFKDVLPENVEMLTRNTNFEVNGYTLSEHGDCGISGASGSANGFNKTFENCIVGHTHSPCLIEKTVYVGTLSKLILCYNQKGMTVWVHGNAIIHDNGTAQIILI